MNIRWFRDVPLYDFRKMVSGLWPCAGRVAVHPPMEGAAMPLLPLEPFIFPDDLLNGPRPGMDDGQPRWVLHARPRAEKALARRLFSRQTSFFLPLYKRQWRTPART